MALTVRMKQLTQLTSRQRSYLGRAVMELLTARLRFGFQSIDRITGDFKRPVAPRQPVSLIDLDEVRWAIAAASSHAPWRSDCLIQAMAVTRWLRRRGVSTNFYLGVKKDDASQLTAHAWVTSGEKLVSGGSERGFQPLITPDQVAHTARHVRDGRSMRLW